MRTRELGLRGRAATTWRGGGEVRVPPPRHFFCFKAATRVAAGFWRLQFPAWDGGSTTRARPGPVCRGWDAFGLVSEIGAQITQRGELVGTYLDSYIYICKK